MMIDGIVVHELGEFRGESFYSVGIPWGYVKGFPVAFCAWAESLKLPIDRCDLGWTCFLNAGELNTLLDILAIYPFAVRVICV